MSQCVQPSGEPVSLAHFGTSQALLDALPTIVWILDASGHCVFANAASKAFSGSDADERTREDWMESFHPEDRARLHADAEAALRGGDALSHEYRMRRHDGIYRWMNVCATPMRDAGGALVGLIGISHDVTERRQTDAALLASEQEVHDLGRVTRDAVWSVDFKTKRVTHGAGMIALYGEAPGDFDGSMEWWGSIVHPDDIDRVKSAFEGALASGASNVHYEYRIRRIDGSYAHVDDRVSILRDAEGRLTRSLGAMRDISQRRMAQEAQARLTRILEATNDFVGISTPDGHVTYLNQAARQLTGLTVDDPMTDTHISTLHPAWAYEIVEKEGIPAAIRDGTWLGETAVVDREGRETPVSQLIIVHRDAQGHLDFLSTVMRDISGRKREEVARMELANRYDAAIRASGQLLFDWNSFTNEITYAGDLHHFLGYGPAEMTGGLDRFRQLVHPDDVEGFDAQIQQVVATRDPFRHDFRLRRKDGIEIMIAANGYFFLDRKGRIGRMIGFFADVTAQRAAEAELARAHDNMEDRVERRTAELGHANAELEDRALQQQTVAALGQRALTGAELSVLLDETATLVRSTLRADYCSILELHPDGSELECISESGWPDPSHSSVPAGYESQSGYTLLVRCPVIMEDSRTEGRFKISPEARVSLARSGATVVIESGAQPIGVLAVFTTELRAFTQDDVNFLQSVANVLTAAIDRKRAEDSVLLAREQAETANRAKSEFLSRMSHDLRTPLNAILGFTQLLEVDHPSPSQAESIEHVSRAGKHLLALINEVLDISRIETGRLALTPEPVEVGAFLREAAELIRPPLPETQASEPIRAELLPRHEPARAPRTLLYIEDQDLNLRLVERIMHSRPEYRLLTAMQGGLGIELAQEHRPDLILLDLNLPDMTGEEVLRRLKGDPATGHIPVLMVSADAIGDRIEEILQLGASGYLTKPYKVVNFLRVIEETLAANPG